MLGRVWWDPSAALCRQELHVKLRIHCWEYQPRRILYERALRNLMVFMFSHYINHLENTGALEGHQTLMVHEYLTVASALGHFTSGKGGYSRETMINRIGLMFRLSARAIFATNTALCWC